MALEVGACTCTSVTCYRKQKSRLPSTYPNQAPVAADGEVLSLFDATRDDDRTTKQQELRFASDFAGRSTSLRADSTRRRRLTSALRRSWASRTWSRRRFPSPHGTTQNGSTSCRERVCHDV